MNRQDQVLTWLYQNRGNLPIKSGKLYQAYQETEGYEGEQNTFSQTLSRLHDRNLLEKTDYATYDLNNPQGNRVARKLLDPDFKEVRRPEGYHDTVEELDNFLIDKKQEDISKAAVRNEKLEIELSELDKFNHELLEFFKENPSEFRDAFEEALELNTNPDWSSQYRFIPDIQTWEMNIAEARNSSNLGRPVIVEGIIRKSEQISPLVVSAIFECTQCGDRYQRKQESTNLRSPYKCACGCRKFSTVEKITRDCMDIQVAERDQMESRITVRILGDSDLDMDAQKSLTTGNKVRILGIVEEKDQGRKKDRKVSTRLQALTYQNKDKKKDVSTIDSEKRKDVLEKIEKSSEPEEDFAKSIAPGLKNLELAKKVISIGMVGAPELDDQGTGTKDYGRVHVGFASNPGMGKTDLLKWTQNTFGKTFYAEGKGGTDTGLTASVEQDKGGEWKLVAGKLVFADKGYLIIDEFDKFQKGELTSLNSAMETGYFNVDKATVSAELPGRATVIVGGNFANKLTNYDRPYEQLPEKGEGLYDRFALFAAITESGEEARTAIMNRHMVGDRGDGNDDVVFDAEELRVYRDMARQCSPKLSQEAANRIEKYIQEQKEHSDRDLKGESNRFVVHLCKVTLAIARLRLKDDTATREDADKAVELMKDSRRSLGLQVGDGTVKNEIVENRKLESVREYYEEMKDDDGKVDITDLVEEVVDNTKLSEKQVEDAISKLKTDGEFYSPERGQLEVLK